MIRSDLNGDFWSAFIYSAAYPTEYEIICANRMDNTSFFLLRSLPLRVTNTNLEKIPADQRKILQVHVEKSPSIIDDKPDFQMQTEVTTTRDWTYQKRQKRGYSKSQSLTYLNPKYAVIPDTVFGFMVLRHDNDYVFDDLRYRYWDYSPQPLVGIFLGFLNVLPKFIVRYDRGTVSRPWDYYREKDPKKDLFGYFKKEIYKDNPRRGDPPKQFDNPFQTLEQEYHHHNYSSSYNQKSKNPKVMNEVLGRVHFGPEYNEEKGLYSLIVIPISVRTREERLQAGLGAVIAANFRSVPRTIYYEALDRIVQTGGHTYHLEYKPYESMYEERMIAIIRAFELIFHWIRYKKDQITEEDIRFFEKIYFYEVEDGIMAPYTREDQLCDIFFEQNPIFKQSPLKNKFLSQVILILQRCLETLLTKEKLISIIQFPFNFQFDFSQKDDLVLENLARFFCSRHYINCFWAIQEAVFSYSPRSLQVFSRNEEWKTFFFGSVLSHLMTDPSAFFIYSMLPHEKKHIIPCQIQDGSGIPHFKYVTAVSKKEVILKPKPIEKVRITLDVINEYSRIFNSKFLFLHYSKSHQTVYKYLIFFKCSLSTFPDQMFDSCIFIDCDLPSGIHYRTCCFIQCEKMQRELFRYSVCGISTSVFIYVHNNLPLPADTYWNGLNYSIAFHVDDYFSPMISLNRKKDDLEKADLWLQSLFHKLNEVFTRITVTTPPCFKDSLDYHSPLAVQLAAGLESEGLHAIFYLKSFL